jgi:hypothetical protein
MLLPHEYSVGCLSDASGVTLVLARSKYEYSCLVASAGDAPMAIVLEGDHAYVAFESGNNTAWKGLLIPGVAIEVDHSTVFNPDMGNCPLGALVRHGGQLSIVARADQNFLRGSTRIPLVTGLETTREGMEAGFTHWMITIGHGRLRRELRTIDVLPK